MFREVYAFPGVLAVCMLAVACAAGPPPDFYLLDSAAPSQLPGFEQGVAVAVGPIDLPEHLNRVQIVTRESPTRLRLSNQHRWAEPLKVGFTRVLMVNLGLGLNSNRIYEWPLKRRQDLDYRVAVNVVRFDGQLGKEVVLAARWTLSSGEGKDVLASQVSVIRELPDDLDYGAFAAAQSRAVANLSQIIANAIKAQMPSAS